MFTQTRSPNRAFGSTGDLAFGRFAETMMLTMMTMLERGRQRAALRELDDRLLTDIGVSHADAMREADKPFWR